MADELKPCPFCGNEAELTCYNENIDDSMAVSDPFSETWDVECCHCGAKPNSDWNNRASAITLWNTRTPTPADPIGDVDKIKEIIKVLDGGEPEYHQEGMGCGLEDRNITDRYEAMEYGWEAAMERVYGEVINHAKDELSALDLSDARIAELQDKCDELEAENAEAHIPRSNVAMSHKVKAVRNEALEEAALVADKRWRQGFMDMEGERAARNICNDIRALKTKEPTKPVEPDVVYNLAAMKFNPKSKRIIAIQGAFFVWDKTPEGWHYWDNQYSAPTQEGRDKIAAMREQFERENG